MSATRAATATNDTHGPRPGRPTKFTETVRGKILWALRLGNYRKAAAAFAGVSERTLTEWLHRGRQDEDGPYAEFLAAVEEAEQEAEIRCLGVIHQAAEKDWKAAAWFLERKFPARYCNRAVLLAARLDAGERPVDELSDGELQEEFVRALETASQSVPREKLLAAIGGRAAKVVSVRDADAEA